MSFKLLEQVSLPGDPTKPNEDSFARLDHAALVLDGATPLGPPLLPGASDAAWIAQFGARRLGAYLKDGDAPEDALRDTHCRRRKKLCRSCTARRFVRSGRRLAPR